MILPKLLPDNLIDAYAEAYLAAGVYPRGWPEGTPYMHQKTIRDLCCYGPLVEVLDELVGEPVALHLNLTGWVSTERAYHQDMYLNPPTVGHRYAGVWMALEDVAPDAGPFQYIPGSHRWPALTRDDVFARLSGDERADPDWPRFTESWVVPHWEEQIAAHGVGPESFMAKRGDVLVWSSHLVHRGSVPSTPGKERRCLIAHYSGARPDMADVRPYGDGRLVMFGELR